MLPNISENITELTGYKPEDFTSNASFWIDNVHPDDKQMLDDNLSNLLEKGIINYRTNIRSHSRANKRPSFK